MQKKIRFILYDYDHLKCTSTLRSIFDNKDTFGWETEVWYVQIDPRIPQHTVLGLLEANADRIRHYRWMEDGDESRFETFRQWEERVEFGENLLEEDIAERKRMAGEYGKGAVRWDFTRAKEGWEDGFLCFTRSGISYGHDWLGFVEKAYARHGDVPYLFHVRGGSQPAYERAVNAYRKTGEEPWGLDQHFMLPCLCFPCYLLPADHFPFSEEIPPVYQEMREKGEGPAGPEPACRKDLSEAPEAEVLSSEPDEEEELSIPGKMGEIFAIWEMILRTLADAGVCVALHKRLRSGGRSVQFRMWNLLVEDEGKLSFLLDGFMPRLLAIAGEHPERRCYLEYNYLFLFRSFMLPSRRSDKGEEKVGTRYREKAEECLGRLTDDKALIFHSGFTMAYKQYILSRKLIPVDPEPDEEEELERHRILSPESNPATIYFMTLHHRSLRILWGTVRWKHEEHRAGISLGGHEFYGQKMKRFNETFWFDRRIMLGETFLASVEIPDTMLDPAHPPQKLVFFFDTEEGRFVNQVKSFGYFAPLSNRSYMFYRKGDWILSCEPEENEIYVEAWTQKKQAKYRRRMYRSMWKNYGKRAVVTRLLMERAEKHLKGRIWLISDRANLADDNGEVFFRYLAEHPVEGVKPYFVLQKKSPDYGRIRKIGKVIEPMSLKHKIYHLLSEYIISSQGNFVVVKPFKKYAPYYSDKICEQRYIFLQHGVTKDDQSAWLSRYNLNIRGLVAATNAEYESFLTGDYYYRPEEVWLTGFPRYDRLYHDEKRQITIMPTWRKTLSSGRGKQGEWLIDSSFAESDFFNFYNDLLNDPALLEAAREYGYTICFKAHPNILPVIGMFDKPEEVLFFDESKPYREIFANADLIVTDYSSVAFDFAYLRKPVVYAQFDSADFFEGGHSYSKGYFDYEEDGFGEVTHTLEETVEVLVEYMKTDCRPKEKYLQRINQTFAYQDQQSCRRVLDRILEDSGKEAILDRRVL